MNDTQLLELLSETDAYADQFAMPDTAWSTEAAFSAVQEQIKRRPFVATSVPTRTAWIAVAAAFAAVLIAGAALLVSLTRTTETPPATTVRPSTTIAPTTTLAPTTTQVPTTTTSSTTTATAEPLPAAADIAVIDRFIAAFNAGDQDAAVAMLAPDGEYLDDITGPPERAPDTASESIESIRAVFQWRADRHQTLDIQQCDLLDSGRISCQVSIDGDIYGAVGGIRGILKVFVSNDEFTYFSLLEPQIGAALDLFGTWLEAEHPGEGDILFSQFPQTDLELWALRAPEYAETWRD